MFIDEKDKLILFELQQDCRQPLSAIAKEVDLPEKTVANRIKNLEKKDIIKKYTVNIDHQKLGYNRHSLYLDLKPIDPKLVSDYLATITSVREVSCCYMLHEISQWKIYVSVWTKDIGRYDEIQGLILQKFDAHILDYVSFQSVRSYTYLSRRLNVKKVGACDAKEHSMKIPITDTDWKIIDEFKEDSRKSLTEIANKLSISIDTLKRRMQYLRENGIIQRFYPILDVKKMGLREYTIIARVKAGAENAIEDFIKWARSDPRFVIVIKAVGWVNLYYAFQVENDDEYRQITMEIDKRIGHITIKTFPIEVENIIH